MNRFKQWILETFFKEEMKDIFTQGSKDAFSKALEDLEETNEYNTEERAKDLMEQRLNRLLSPIDPKQIITVDKQRGIVFVGGERADDLMLSNLKQEAEALTQFRLWELLFHTPNELAQRSMFVKGETLVDMQNGKSMLFTLDTQKKIIDLCKSFSVKK